MRETSLPALILASSSRYRAQLLERLRLPFVVDAADIDESSRAGETAPQTAQRLARAKATAVAGRHPGALIIGSDQVAECRGQQIGKPGDFPSARSQLLLQSGQTVVFHTALCLYDSVTSRCDQALAVVRVRFRELSIAQIEAYLRAEAPFDCAGSAKAEGLGIALLEEIGSDDPTALIGLPLIYLVSMLERAGYPVLGTSAADKAAP